MGVKVTNNAFGTISAGINSSVTTIALDTGQGAKFPTLTGSDFFFATIIDTSNNLEVVKVTARSSDSMTVVRGHDNTSARSFSAGDRFELRPVAALFESISMNSFTLTGDSGSNQTVEDGNTVDIAGGTGIDTVVGATDTVTVSVDSTIKKVGKETIWVPAVSIYPNTTNGCAAIAQTELSNGPEIKTLDFDKDSDEFAQFAIAFPKSWNEGTVTFQAFFTADSTNTGTVSWNLSGVAFADNDSINTAFGTGVAPTAKAHSGTANDLDVTAESGAITIAGSPSTDEQVFFQIQRDVSEDSLTADAKLLGIKLFFTTDAGNDA